MRGHSNLVTRKYSPTWREFPIYGAAADIKGGSPVIMGTTEEQDNGMVIITGATLADVVGVLETLHDYSKVGDSDDATGSFVWGKVDINPFSTFLVEYDQAENDSTSYMTGATSSSGTITLATFDNAGTDTGWWYCHTGTGKGQLRYIKTYASGAPVVATDFTTDLVAADKSLLISPMLHQLVGLSVDKTCLVPSDAGTTDGSVPTGAATIIANYIKSDGISLQRLDADKHDGLDSLDDSNVRFYAEIFFHNHAFNPLS